MPIIKVSADLLSHHTCCDHYIVVSVFAVTSYIILIGYVSSLLLNVCTVLPSSLILSLSNSYTQIRSFTFHVSLTQNSTNTDKRDELKIRKMTEE